MKQKLFISTCVFAVSSGAMAEINFSGFATFAGGTAFGDEEVSSATVHGYDEDFSVAPNSFLGLQVVADIYGNLDATVQGTVDSAEGWDTVDNVDFDLTWAFLSYDITDNWRVIAGRQRMPHYMYSDYLTVSYAYHWIEAPTQLYNAPFDSFNGISVLNNFYWRDFTISTQFIYGEEPDSEEDIGKEYSDIWGGKVSVNYDWLTATAAYFEFDQYSESTRPGPGGTTSTEIEEGTLISWDLGLQAELGSWLIIGELTSVDLSDLSDRMGTKKPWMLSVAKNIGSFTPHVSYGYNRELDFGDDDSETWFYTIGTRWDVLTSSAVKVELSGEENNDGDVGYSIEAAFVTVF